MLLHVVCITAKIHRDFREECVVFVSFCLSVGLSVGQLVILLAALCKDLQKHFHEAVSKIIKKTLKLLKRVM